MLALHTAVVAGAERMLMPFFVVVSRYRDITAQDAALGQAAGDARMTGPFESRAAASQRAAELKTAHAAAWPWTVVDVLEARDARTAANGSFARWLSQPERLEAIEEGRRDADRLYAALQPYEQKELVSLVVRRVTVSDREIALEINGGVCGLIAATPPERLGAGWFSQTPVGLRDQDSNLEPIG